MNRNTPRDVKAKMIQALSLMKEALDMSIPLIKSGQKRSIIMLWEAFIGEFIDYIKYKSNQTGINLIDNISIKRIWFR